MLKWDDAQGTIVLSRRRWAGWIAIDATPADIIACLAANPEALTPERWATVLAALSPETQDGITNTLVDRDVKWGTDSLAKTLNNYRARAEQAERALATVTAEREEARAKLTDAERMRDTLGRHIDEVQAALNECGADFTGQKESTRIRALRSRLAKAEAALDVSRNECAALRASEAAEMTELKAKLAEAETDRDVAWATNRDNLVMWEVERDALRRRIARHSAVVLAAQKSVDVPTHPDARRWLLDALRDLDAGDEDSGGSGSSSGSSEAGCTPGPSDSSPLDACDQRLARLGVPVARRHAPDDSRGGSGTDSGGSGGTPVRDSGDCESRSQGSTPTPEPAGSSCRCGAGCKPVPRYDGDGNDSPVGVAATAECSHPGGFFDMDGSEVCGHCGVITYPGAHVPPAVAGTDSGGSGAAHAGGQSPPPARATGDQAQSQGRQLGATQRAAGANDEPPLRELRSEAHRRACEQAAEQLAGSDSPVGVAATAECQHPDEDWDHDGRSWVCHQCGARESDAQPPATRAELEELRRRVEELERSLRYVTGLMPQPE